MQFFVLTWLLLEVTGDETSLVGLMFAIYGIPNSVLLMPAGLISDRVNRKLLLMGTQATVGALITLVALLAMLGAVALWHIFLAAALLGVLQGLNMPARLVVLSDLVAERRLLANMDDRPRLRRHLRCGGAQVVLAARRQCIVEFGREVEMVLDRRFAARGDEHEGLDPGCPGFFDSILDQRLVHHRQHFLRHRLGRRQEPRAEPAGRNDRCRHRSRHG